MRSSTAQRIAWPAFGLFACLAAVGFFLVVRAHDQVAENTVFGLIFLSLAAVGAVIASRRPENPIGWLLLFSSCVVAVGFVASSYSTYGYRVHAGSLPFLRWMAWLSTWPWALAIGSLITFVFLLFPDGHVPSSRWGPVAWACGIDLAIVCLAVALTPGPIEGAPTTNPIGIPGTRALMETVTGFAFILLTVLAMVCVASLVVRFRRAAGEERKQIAWVLFAACLLAVDVMIDAVFEILGYQGAWFLTALSAVAFVSVPVAVGISILKYRLYDIDAVVKKSVVIGVLAVFITSVYLGVVVGIGALVGTRRNIFLSIVATAIIALAFQPIRERAHRLADRLVYGNRATPYEVMSEFSERAAGTYSTEDVLPKMAQILAAGTGATAARVWLRVGSELRPAASWPGNGVEAPVPIIGDDLPSFPEREHAFPVRHSGELLGAISVVASPSDPLTPVQQKLLSDVAAQTGLVLRNVRLIEELRESRRRIVTAQDQRAKMLERNIHDGAQQQLVALSVKQRLAESLIDRDPQQARRMMAEIQTDTVGTLENLRDLARGIYPPLLADQGLPAALEPQIRKATFPAELFADGLGRYTQDVEAAVYFCCLEALQNVAKYAQASRVDVRLRQDDGWLTFVVADDGVGFDPAGTRLGTGLQGMTDRLEALGGALEIRSQPREGTTLTGRVPTRSSGS